MRDALRHLLAKHRGFADADWAIPEIDLVSLEAVFESLKPQNPEDRHRWLFKSGLSYRADTAWEVLQAEQEGRQRNAAAELLAELDADELLSFTQTVTMHHALGLAIARADVDPAIKDRALQATLKDSRSDRLLLGFGHALTIDSAQGITSGEHINALPRGTAGITAFKSYVAESRHVTQVHTIISEAATFEAVKRERALGDQEPITTGHLWERVAKDMSDKPYKSLAIDLIEAIKRGQAEEVDRFIRTEHRVFAQRAAGRDHADELRRRQRNAEVRAVLAKHIVPLFAAVERREAAIRELAEAVNAFPDVVRAKFRAAVITANEKREAELARAAFTRRPGVSPGL